LNGELGAGFTYSKGNQSLQYNLNSSVSYPAERWSAGASYNSNFTSNTGVSNSTRNEVTLNAQRLLRWNNWYYTGVVDFLQSSVQGIQLESTFGGGIGRYLKNTGPTTFQVYGGFAWQRINYQEAFAAPTQQVTSALLGTSLRLFRFDKTTLTFNANILPAISQPGRVHFNLNTSYYVKLWGKLNWNFTLYGNWDNRPPPGFVGSDYGKYIWFEHHLWQPLSPNPTKGWAYLRRSCREDAGVKLLCATHPGTVKTDRLQSLSLISNVSARANRRFRFAPLHSWVSFSRLNKSQRRPGRTYRGCR